MAEEHSPEQVAAEQAGMPVFTINKMFVKDVSFEVPNAPQIYKESGEVEVKMNLSQRVNEMGDNDYEVVLSVTVTASTEEKTAYLAEVQQAGIFHAEGFEQQQLHVLLNTACPHTLFPYASRAISSLVGDGGFPPVVLQPVNFDHLYSQRVQEMQTEQQAEPA